MKPASYAIKAEVSNSETRIFVLPRQKTMYGGKTISVGDSAFIFASENDGGEGLLAYGVVTAAVALPLDPRLERQTPRISVTIQRTATAKRRLGRKELKPHTAWNDGRPETELNFKFYRQATNKVVGISAETAAYLHSFF